MFPKNLQKSETDAYNVGCSVRDRVHMIQKQSKILRKKTHRNKYIIIIYKKISF